MGDTGLPADASTRPSSPYNLPDAGIATDAQPPMDAPAQDSGLSRTSSFSARAQSQWNLGGPLRAVVTDPDEQRRLLTRGLRFFQEGRLDQAKENLAPIFQIPLAQDLLKKIEISEQQFYGRQLGTLLKAVVQDQATQGIWDEGQKNSLFSTIDLLENDYFLLDKSTLKKTLATLGPQLSQGDQALWSLFSSRNQSLIDSLDSVFQDPDPSVRAHSLMNIALDLQKGDSAGASWWAARLASEDDETRNDAQSLIAYLEGRQRSTEFFVSELFNQGGTSMAINLIALIPTVGLTRKLYRMRPLYAYLAGGLLHWASQKSLMWATGFDGAIMPHSIRDFAGQLGSSYLQSTAAIFLANRLLWKNVPKALDKEINTAAAATAPVHWSQSLARAGMWGVRGLWAGTKLSLKVGGMSAAGLGAQYLGHITHLQSMTAPGLPTFVMKLFPKTRETRREVFQTANVRKLLEPYAGDSLILIPPPHRVLDFDPAQLLLQWDPSIDGRKSEIAAAELADAATRGDFGLNIRRWITRKIAVGEYANANATFQRQKIPLQVEGGILCIVDSKEFSCKDN